MVCLRLKADIAVNFWANIRIRYMVDTPNVFISYSHDNDEHKQWVRKLASDLRNNGIDVILDQWDIGPGDDLTAFMEKGVTSADRVLVVSSPRYVQKANVGEGGVGWVEFGCAVEQGNGAPGVAAEPDQSAKATQCRRMSGV